MANSKEIGSWLIANSKHLNLSVKNATWIQEWLPEYSHIFVEITIDGNTVTGSSIDKSSDMAFIKAGAEAIERLVCVENDLHSNGVAAHINYDLAEENAKDELLERDSFLSHFIGNVPFIKPSSSFLESKLFVNISSRLKSLGVELKIVKLKSQVDKHGFACFCLPSGQEMSFSSVIGLGFSSTEVESFEKAILECLPAMIWYLNNSKEVELLSSDVFLEDRSFSPDDHRNLYLNKYLQEEMKNIVNNIVPSLENDNSSLSFEYTKLKSKSAFINDSPISVIRATSDDIQNIFYGPTDLKFVNIDRLKQFAEHEISQSNINLLPHCVG
jgi:hypothetical protein